jgi:hypothetical protein
MTFIGYEVQDDGILLTFLCGDPGAGEASLWPVMVTNAELAAVTTLTEFRNLVITKLQRKYRAAGIASKLDGLIGQSVTV